MAAHRGLTFAVMMTAMLPEPIEFRAPRGRMLLMLVGSLAFVVLGAFLALASGNNLKERLAGLLSVIFFGFCTILVIAELVRPRMRAVLNANGIRSDSPFGTIFDLPWSELMAVQIVQMNRQPIVVLETYDKNWGMTGVKPATVALRKMNAGLVGSWLTLAPRNYGLKPEQLLAEVCRFREAYGPESASG